MMIPERDRKKMKGITVGRISVVAPEQYDGGKPLSILIAPDTSPNAEFDFQAKDRSLDLSVAELNDLVAAANALKETVKEEDCIAHTNVSSLTREAIIRTARNFDWHRTMPKWTVIVEGVELPARPLVLEAAGVPPNDPTNSHKAVAKLKALNFDTRYQGKSV